MTVNNSDVVYVDIARDIDDVEFTALHPEEVSSNIRPDINGN